jgi:transcriptional regulator with XRE-family HTH domain
MRDRVKKASKLDCDDVGARVRKIRQEHGIGSRDIPGVSQSVLIRFELGERDATITKLRCIARALGVSVSTLLGE